MASLPCMAPLGCSCVTPVSGNLVASPWRFHVAARSQIVTGARGFVARPSFSDRLLMRTQRKRGDVYTARAEGPEGGGRAPGAPEAPDALDISVFRFTLGIPGFDDADLPRVLGVLFGSLLVLNHFFSLSSVTAAQWRSEGVGLVLAVLSVSLPFIGRRLNGANKIERKLEAGQKQIFCLADGLTEAQRQDLAWVSYNLIRNTSTTAMLVCHASQVVAARGFWGALPDSDPDVSVPLGYLGQKLEAKLEDFSTLKEPLYLPGNAELQGWDIVPEGAASVLVQPFPKDANLETEVSCHGFLLLISNTTAGYRRKDRLWTSALAKKLSEALNN